MLIFISFGKCIVEVCIFCKHIHSHINEYSIYQRTSKKVILYIARNITIDHSTAGNDYYYIDFKWILFSLHIYLFINNLLGETVHGRMFLFCI